MASRFEILPVIPSTLLTCCLFTPGFRALDDLMGPQLLHPHNVKNPRTDLSYLAYSSGTSGKAKGVMLSHYSVVVCAPVVPAS